MNTWHSTNCKDWAYSTIVLITTFAAFLCLQHQCRAQQALAAQSVTALDTLKYVTWVSGPQEVTLGDIADINIPYGYRLTDVHGARMILANLNDPIPDDLVGILAPASGKWMAILEYAPDGYLKNPDGMKVDTKAVLNQVLNQINAQQGQSSVASLVWQTQPAYDVHRHLLEWSFEIITPASAKILNQTTVLLGRHGVLEVTVAHPFSSADAPSLNQLINDINFKGGERYADYHSGDKVAEVGLAELILGDKPAPTGGAFSERFGSATAWIYCGFAVCLIAGGVVVVRRRNKTQGRQAPVHTHSTKHKSRGNGASSAQSIAVANAKSNGHALRIPVTKNGSKHHHHHHRRRIFDHSKFYMKVMRDLSRSSYDPAIMTNGKNESHGHNSHVNGDSNGHVNGHTNGHAASNGTNANQTTKSEMEDLIASQKKLIEDQKRLLEQQSRLIDEKRSLIEKRKNMPE